MIKTITDKITKYAYALQSNMRVSMVEVSFSVIKASTIHKMWANSMESTLNPTSSENVFWLRHRQRKVTPLLE